MEKIVKMSPRVHWPGGRVEEPRPITEGEYLEQNIGTLRKLLNNYSDEIPSETVHSTSPINNYKCRAAWWTVLRMRLSDLEKKGYLAEDISKRYHTTAESYAETLKNNGGRTSAENITAANSLLREVISYLETRLTSP